MEPAAALSKRDVRFLTMALGVALGSKCRVRHGAILVKNGKVLSVSPNIFKNDPKFVDWRFSSIHAELAVLRKAGWPRKGTVYVGRVNKAGNLARMSKPCSNCQAILDKFQCRVVFTESKGA